MRRKEEKRKEMKIRKELRTHKLKGQIFATLQWRDRVGGSMLAARRAGGQADLYPLRGGKGGSNLQRTNSAHPRDQSFATHEVQPLAIAS